MPQLEITKELYAQISESAKRAGLSINQYLENRILDNPPIKPLTTLSSDNLASTQLNEKQNHTKQMLFLQAILDMLHVQLAVLDEVGVIVYVNKAWIDFPLGNGESPETETVGTNYLEVCENALGDDSKVAHSFAAGIRAVISGEQSTFSLEYPCHSPTEQRWFLGHVFAMPDNQEGKALIIYQDITTRKLLEIEARTNEIRYRAIFENFPNGMVALYDEDLRYTMADGEGLAQVGMTNADLVGKRLRDVFPPEVHKRDEPALLAALDGEVVDSLVNYAGQYFRVTTLPVKDDEEKIINGMVLTQNITALLEAGKRQKELGEQLELVINSANLGVWSMDIKTKQFTWNERMYDIFGVTKDTFDLHFDNFMKCVHPKDRDHIRHIFEKILAEGNINDEGFRIVRPDNEIRYIETSGYAVYDDNSEVTKILGINRDVTEIERSRQALRDSEERYRTLFNGTLNPIAVYDSEARFVMVNDTLVKNLGRPREDIIGRPLGDFIPQKQEITVERIARVIAKREIISFEDKIELEAGEFWFWSVMQPVFTNEGQSTEVMVISYDITERKHAEALTIERTSLARQLVQEQELAETRNRLFSTISHEFRTPLSIISSSSQMLAKYYERYTGDELRDRIAKISRQVHHLDRLLVEVTLLAKFRNKFFAINVSSVDIEELCQNILSELEDIKSDIHELKLELDVQQYNIVVDEQLLRHALTNILSNAIKYSPNGGQILLQVLQTNNEWRFIAKDEGIGIPPKEQSDLFNPFTRASNVGNIMGTGIGLSLVKEISELHGGSVEVESELGVGSIFTIIIPNATSS